MTSPTPAPRARTSRRAPWILVSVVALAGLAVAAAGHVSAGHVSAEPAATGYVGQGPPIGQSPSDGPGDRHGVVTALDAASQGVVGVGAVGHLAYVDDGRHLTTLAHGLADRATGRALKADDRFEIGSVTKTFVATLTLMSVGRRELALEDPVEKLLPGVVPGGDKITLRMLLNHTSGLFNYTLDEAFVRASYTNPTRVWTPAEEVAVANSHDPYFAPGAGWKYSNTNYVLVGMILEGVTGRRLADLLQERIARPLGLRRTLLVTNAVPDSGPGFAHGYLASFATTPATYVDTVGSALGGWAGAAGAMISTAPELARFLSALLGGRLLPPHLLAEMQRTVETPSGGVGYDEGYGLGIRKTVTPCGTVWGHVGDTIGHRTTARVSPDGHRIAITDTSTQPSQLDGANAGAKALADAYDRAELVSVCAMYGRTPPPA